MLATTGAPHMWLTRCEPIAEKIEVASVERRQTWTPACSVIVYGKHQPLQWNIGSVHR